MKMIVRIDVLGQTLLIGLYAVMICLKGVGSDALLTGTILVNWQIMSCVLTMFFSSKRRMEYVVFAVAAISFQVFLNAVFIVDPGWNLSVFSLVMYAVPPVLVTYYYLLTLIFPFRRDNHKGKFLPHTSF